MTNEQVVLEMFRAVEERDAEALASIYAPEVTFEWPPELPYGGEYRGSEVAAMTDSFGSAWFPLQRDEGARQMHPRVLGTPGDDVVVAYRQAGATETCSIEADVIGVYTLAEGRVCRLKMFYFDPAKVAEFLHSSQG